jgi:hypothetical protein
VKSVKSPVGGGRENAKCRIGFGGSIVEEEEEEEEEVGDSRRWVI